MRMLCLLLCLPNIGWAAPLLRSEGLATGSDGSVLYREGHWQDGPQAGAQRWVQYECPDGRPFARKQLPASGRAQVRGYRLQDMRSGQDAVVEVASGAVRIQWRESTAAARRERELALPADAVVDMGFDAAVRQHWGALMRGETLTLPFLVPGRQQFYPVKVIRRAALRWEGHSAQQIEVALAAWYGGLAPRLRLVYADADQRLLEFRGTSNLRDAEGGYPQVTVRFAQIAQEQGREDYRRQWSRPLIARCHVNKA